MHDYLWGFVRPTISLSVCSDHVQGKISLACILCPRVDTLEGKAVITDLRLCVPILTSQSSFSSLASKLFSFLVLLYVIAVSDGPFCLSLQKKCITRVSSSLVVHLLQKKSSNQLRHQHHPVLWVSRKWPHTRHWFQIFGNGSWKNRDSFNWVLMETWICVVHTFYRKLNVLKLKLAFRNLRSFSTSTAAAASSLAK